MAAAYGKGRDKGRTADWPLEDDFGHLERRQVLPGDEGFAGLNQGLIPKHLIFHNPTPEVELAQLLCGSTATQRSGR